MVQLAAAECRIADTFNAGCNDKADVFCHNHHSQPMSQHNKHVRCSGSGVAHPCPDESEIIKKNACWTTVSAIAKMLFTKLFSKNKTSSWLLRLFINVMFWQNVPLPLPNSKFIICTGVYSVTKREAEYY